MSKIKEISESLGISDIKNLGVRSNLSDGLIDSLLRVFFGDSFTLLHTFPGLFTKK